MMPTLTRQQIDQFFDVGFFVVPDLFSKDEISLMRDAFARLERTAHRLGKTQMHRGSRFVLERIEGDRVRIHRIVWCGGAEPVLSTFGKDPRLVGMAAALLGSDRMDQLINQAHFKLPGDGVEFPWHQDSSNRRFGGDEWRDVNGRGSYVQTVIAIDDATDENGALRLIPRSCRRGHLAAPDGSYPPRLLDESAAVTATMQAGSALVFGPYTLHKSEPNRSNRGRRAFINGYAFPGANSRVYPGSGTGRPLTARVGW